MWLHWLATRYRAPYRLAAAQCVVPPAVEPVTIAQVALQVRMDDDAPDSVLLPTYIQAARENVEAQCAIGLLAQTWRVDLDGFGVVDRREVAPADDVIIVPGVNVAVTSITYFDHTGQQQTLDNDQYTVSTLPQFARISRAFGVHRWPWTQHDRPGSVSVTYSTGYGATADAVPAAIVTSVLLLAADMYTNRTATNAAGSTENPLIAQLLGPYRAVTI